MKRLTEKDFNFTSDFVASNLQSYPIAEALKKLQEHEDIEERLEEYRPKHSFTGTLQRMLIALGTASSLELIDNILSEHNKDIEELDELQIEIEVEMQYGAD